MNFTSAVTLAMFLPLIVAAVVLRRTLRKAAARRRAKFSAWNQTRWTDAASSPQSGRKARRPAPRSAVHRAA